MFSYRNNGNKEIIVQAGASVENPRIKKFYRIAPNETIQIPVELTSKIDNLEFIGVESPKKKRKTDDELKNKE